MSKKTPGAARVLDTGSNQDTLDNDEAALLDSMRQDDGEGLDQDEGGGGGGEGGKVAAAAPAPKSGDGQQPAGEGKPKNDSVPLATFLEQKNEVKRLEKQLEESNTRFNTLETRTNIILERLAPKPPEEVVPDFKEDPGAWIAWKMNKDGKTLEEVQAELTTMKKERADTAAQTEAQKKQQAFVKDISDYAISQEEAFMATTPDYMEASAFLLKSRTEELEDAGWTKQEIAQILNNERFAIAQKAKADGKNPAEVVYKISKRRGFVASKAGEGDKGGKGGAAAPAASGAERLENIDRGQQQSRSLSQAPGEGPSPMTAKRLLEMSEAQFDAFKEANPDEFRRLMGS